MKASSKNQINNLVLVFLALITVFICGCGCNTSKPTPDPLAGWKAIFREQPNQIVEKDYQDYIQKTPHGFVMSVGWLEDGKGQHAVDIEMSGKGGIFKSLWRHILIYDKDNHRIKTIKYKLEGSYGC